MLKAYRIGEKPCRRLARRCCVGAAGESFDIDGVTGICMKISSLKNFTTHFNIDFSLL